MNERIQELIRLSAVPADQAPDYALSKGLIEPAEKLDVAKFAELIVRECMEQVWYSCEDGINGNVSEVIKDRIQKHFGVE